MHSFWGFLYAIKCTPPTLSPTSDQHARSVATQASRVLLKRCEHAHMIYAPSLISD
jgi:hypothetical protein